MSSEHRLGGLIGTRVRRALLGDDRNSRRRQATAIAQLRRRQEKTTVALGTLMAHQIAGTATSIADAEFSVFSQFGEDGIIEFILRDGDITPSTFVEIGVETYVEANTRFLAEHRLWRGLIVDRNPSLSRDLGRTNLDWRSQVSAVSAFVTRETVASIVEPFASHTGIGLLSLDVDGVDYWLLEQLVAFDPAVVIVEYNALFGPTSTVTIPYSAAFDRRLPEYHGIYYGASLAAFVHLLAAHGYSLITCNGAGNNAFFVRADRLGALQARTARDAYNPRRFVEHRAIDGALTGTSDARLQLCDIRELPLVDVTDGSSTTVADLL